MPQNNIASEDEEVNVVPDTPSPVFAALKDRVTARLNNAVHKELFSDPTEDNSPPKVAPASTASTCFVNKRDHRNRLKLNKFDRYNKLREKKKKRPVLFDNFTDSDNSDAGDKPQKNNDISDSEIELPTLNLCRRQKSATEEITHKENVNNIDSFSDSDTALPNVNLCRRGKSASKEITSKENVNDIDNFSDSDSELPSLNFCKKETKENTQNEGDSVSKFKFSNIEGKPTEKDSDRKLFSESLRDFDSRLNRLVLYKPNGGRFFDTPRVQSESGSILEPNSGSTNSMKSVTGCDISTTIAEEAVRKNIFDGISPNGTNVVNDETTNTVIFMTKDGAMAIPVSDHDDGMGLPRADRFVSKCTVNFVAKSTESELAQEAGFADGRQSDAGKGVRTKESKNNDGTRIKDTKNSNGAQLKEPENTGGARLKTWALRSKIRNRSGSTDSDFKLKIDKSGSKSRDTSASSSRSTDDSSGSVKRKHDQNLDPSDLECKRRSQEKVSMSSSSGSSGALNSKLHISKGKSLRGKSKFKKSSSQSKSTVSSNDKVSSSISSDNSTRIDNTVNTDNTVNIDNTTKVDQIRNNVMNTNVDNSNVINIDEHNDISDILGLSPNRLGDILSHDPWDSPVPTSNTDWDSIDGGNLTSTTDWNQTSRSPTLESFRQSVDAINSLLDTTRPGTRTSHSSTRNTRPAEFIRSSTVTRLTEPTHSTRNSTRVMDEINSMLRSRSNTRNTRPPETTPPFTLSSVPESSWSSTVSVPPPTHTSTYTTHIGGASNSTDFRTDINTLFPSPYQSRRIAHPAFIPASMVLDNSPDHMNSRDNRRSTRQNPTPPTRDSFSLDVTTSPDVSVEVVVLTDPTPSPGSSPRPTRRSASLRNRVQSSDSDVIIVDDFNVAGSTPVSRQNQQISEDVLMARRLQEEADLELASILANTHSPQAPRQPPHLERPHRPIGGHFTEMLNQIPQAIPVGIQAKLRQLSEYGWNVHQALAEGRDMPPPPRSERDASLESILDPALLDYMEAHPQLMDQMRDIRDRGRRSSRHHGRYRTMLGSLGGSEDAEHSPLRRTRSSRGHRDLDARASGVRGHMPFSMLHPSLMEGTRQYMNNERYLLGSYEQLLELGDRIGQVQQGLTSEEINLLPTKIFSVTQAASTSTNDGPPECNVCFGEYEEKEKLRILTCFHEFHSECIDKWLKTNKTCPICRAVIKFE